MSDYEQEDPMDSPLTGKEGKAEQAPGFRILIEASNWDETRISDMVLNRIGERFEEKLRDAIEEKLAQAVGAAVDRVVDAKILEQAEVILREGWTETDTYGHPKKKVTFPERVHTLLNRSDSYNRQTSLEQLIKGLVESAVTKELKPEIDAAKAQVQTLLNGTLATKLLQAMKEGVGLR